MKNRPSPDLAWKHLADTIPEYTIVLLDAAGAITDWGAGAERNIGLRAEDARGSHWSRFVSGGDAAASALLADARRDGQAEHETQLLRADGSSFVAELTVSAISDHQAAVAGFVVVARDVSEERRLRAALRDADARFTGIISISTDAIVSADEDQRIMFFNQGAEQVFGYSAEEAIGQPLEILIPHRHRPGHAAQVETFGEGTVEARRMGERGQISGLRSNGDVFPADASISRYFIGGRRIYTAVLRDSTERQRTEEALARQAEDLARSNADLEQFAYVASHDLQEPLRMVASYTQLLARRYRDKLDEDAHEFIGYAVDGVTRMQALINDLLAYSRVGTRGVDFSRVDLDAVLDRVLTTLGPAMEEQGATVIRDPLPAVRADSGQMGQLFQNLIGNAIKFRRPDAPPVVRISAARQDAEWVFSVSDNGIGMDAGYADRIFVIFQRLHNRTEYPGTGIGLAICKKIVERHGGRIWFTSLPGEGTTFFFALPEAE